MKRSSYLLLGFLFVGLGILGAFLPILPSTCFFIFAAYFFSYSSPRLENWILNHRVFGPPVRGWRRNRSIPFGGKVAALLGMTLSAIILIYSAQPVWVLVLSLVILVGSAIYVVCRPTLRLPAKGPLPATSLRST